MREKFAGLEKKLDRASIEESPGKQLISISTMIKFKNHWKKA
jgi:hypothetical protein